MAARAPALLAGGGLRPWTWVLTGLALVLGSVGVADTASGLERLAPVLVLLGLKTIVDLALHLWERSRAASGPAADMGVVAG